MDVLSYMKYYGNVRDGCLECNGMIRVNASDLIPHLSTDFARRHLTSEFEMGSAARACSTILCKSNVNIIAREVFGKVIIDERQIAVLFLYIFLLVLLLFYWPPSERWSFILKFYCTFF